MPKEVEMVTIPLKEYEDLLQSAKELQNLDDAGVDNWEWHHLRYKDITWDDEDFGEDIVE
jgi:hypothetical protein